jgi:hypothetical protein
MEFVVSELFPGAATPFGTVAYATETHVWVHTLDGVRCYPLRREPPGPTKGVAKTPRPRLYIVSRHAA